MIPLDFIPTTLFYTHQQKIVFKSLFPAVVRKKNASNSGSLNNCREGSSSKLFTKIKRASVSLEASLAFPVILTFFFTLLWIIELFWIHTEIETSLYTLGNEVASCSYAYSSLFSPSKVDSDICDEISKIVFNEAYVIRKIKNTTAGRMTKNMSAILSDVRKKNEIDILVTYYVPPIVKIPGLKGPWLSNHFYSKAFLGDCVFETKEIEDTIVYISKSGSVYHTSLSCQTIKSQINIVSASEIATLRSKDGAKYYSCSKCGKEKDTGKYYITPYGNRFHKNLNCSELKIDIYPVRLSTVKGRRKCKLCP